MRIHIHVHAHAYYNIYIHTYVRTLQRVCCRCVRWCQTNTCIMYTPAHALVPRTPVPKCTQHSLQKNAHIYVRTHTCIRIQMHTNTHAHPWHGPTRQRTATETHNLCTNLNTHTYTQAYTCIRTLIHMHMRIYTYILFKFVHIHTYIYTHAHSLILMSFVTENNSLEPLLEGLLHKNHYGLS